MLPPTYQEHCQTFRQALQGLRTQATVAQPDGLMLQSAFLEAQQFFQRQLINFDFEELPPADEVRVRSLHTEISKYLRLLGMDVTFLQAARQTVTTQQRQAQIRDRVERLLQYCDWLLSTDSEET
jgi:hypothetical protein